MTKQEIDNVVNKFKQAGVTNWIYHCEEGGRREHNGESSIVIHGDDYLYVFALSRNYSDTKGAEFEMVVLPYERVCHIVAVDVHFESAKKLLDGFSIQNEETKTMMTTFPKRMILNTEAKAGQQGAIYDEEGKVTVPKGVSGYVVQ